MVIYKEVNLSISNAGEDDGLPPSLLRQFSYLKGMENKFVTKIYDIKVKKSIVSMISEYCDFSLKEYILKPLSQKEVKKIILQILQAVEYIHSIGLMHRNLKSDNIMIKNCTTNDNPIAKNYTSNNNNYKRKIQKASEQDLQVKLSDFSLSKQVCTPHLPYTPEDPKDRERSGRESKRLHYRAPELLLRKNIYAFEVDIWSVGILLAEIILKETLFTGETEIEMLFNIFQLIGSPTKEELDLLEINKNYQCTFPKWAKKSFIELSSKNYKLKQIREKIGKSGLDLLQQLLTFNPHKRITAKQALKHEFFNEKIIMSVPEKSFDMTFLETLLFKEEMKIKDEQNLSLKRNFVYITQQMRQILIDWLLDVSIHFEVQEETLHYCVSYLDSYLKRQIVEKQKLQLIGVTCMKIADVFNEKSKEYYKQENSTDYAYITAEEYTPEQLVKTEKQLLEMLNFDLRVSTVVHYLKVFFQAYQVSQQVQIQSLFIADFLLLADEFKQKNSQLALSILQIVSSNYNEKLVLKEKQLDSTIESISEGINEAERFIREQHRDFRNSSILNFQSIFQKYIAKYETDFRELEL